MQDFPRQIQNVERGGILYSDARTLALGKGHEILFHGDVVGPIFLDPTIGNKEMWVGEYGGVVVDDGGGGGNDCSGGDVRALEIPASRGGDTGKTAEDPVGHPKTLFYGGSQERQFFEGGEGEGVEAVDFGLQAWDERLIVSEMVENVDEGDGEGVCPGKEKIDGLGHRVECWQRGFGLSCRLNEGWEISFDSSVFQLLQQSI